MKLNESRMKFRFAMFAFLALGALCWNLGAEIAVKEGDAVAFLGDSITQGGWSNPGGYVRLVVKGLEANDIKITPVPAGISGHKSNQMLERLGRDVLDKHPTWMTLSCGVNDVWHGERGVPLDQYKTNIATIISKCEAAGVKVIVLTATVIGEDLQNDTNGKLAPYNEFLRQFAKEKGCRLADLNSLFQEAIRAGDGHGRLLTSDGVHMNPSGDQLMARGVLRAMGLDDAQMQKAKASWLDIANGATLQSSYVAGRGQVLRASARVTLRQYEQLQVLARKRATNLKDLVDAGFAEEARCLLRPKGAYDSFEALFREKKPAEINALMQEGFARRIDDLVKEAAR
jgi:lysophospholipase L1-like esterase